MNADNGLTAFSNWMTAKGHPTSTIGTYLSGAKAFYDFFHSADHPKNISSNQIISFLASEPNPHTRKSIRCAVKLFYTVVVHQPNKFDNIPPVKIPKSLPTILTPAEVFSIIQAKNNNPKHQSVLQLIYSGAMRISEPTRIKIPHFYLQFDPLLNKDVPRLHIIGAKGGKDRIIPLPIETWNMVENYKKVHTPTPADFLFQGQKKPQYSKGSIRAIFNDACVKAEIIKDVTPHSFRHSCLTHLLEGGMDLFYLKEFAGHESIKTTMIYLHCSPSAMARAQNSANQYVKAMVNRVSLAELYETASQLELQE